MEHHPLHFYLTATYIKKYIDGYDVKDFFPTYINNIKRTKFDLKKVSENVYQKVINNHFTKQEFATFLLHNSIYNKDFLKSPFEWNVNEICNISKVYNKSSLEADREFIIKISQKTGMKEIQKYFDINSDGESIWYKFLMQKYISPMFIISLINKINVNYEEESLEHKQVRRIINAIQKIESNIK
jgi:hypothetical protein